MTDRANTPMASARQLELLAALEKKALWLSSWMIHNANHLRPNDDGLKVGGHQASCASITTLMSALYFHLLRPQDRVAVKPHAAPVFHAIQYLLGQQSLENIQNLRAFGGAQSYPSRTKDADDVDFSTGSVGLGAGMTIFAALAQDYLKAKGWLNRPEGRMIALIGDAELDEGNIYEALLEGWKHDLRNCWWVVDYNRQSLDGVISEFQYSQIHDIFRSFGWDVITLKHGLLQQAAFAEPGGERLRQWIDDCSNELYSALTFQGGAAWRQALTADFAGDAEMLALVERRNDEALGALMVNLGGHDLPSILQAMSEIEHDRPVCFIAYTIKGYGLPLQGHKDNHAGVMTNDQIARMKGAMNIADGAEWTPLAGLDDMADDLTAYLADNRFASEGTRRYRAPAVDIAEVSAGQNGREVSTQEGFGQILNELARGDSDLADRLITMSPDVTVSTNLGPFVNRRGLFAKDAAADTFREENVPSLQRWERKPDGQHLELGIAENNLFTALAAFGLSHSLFGERLLPIGTLYDPFIQRGLDALNYACYQDARFLLVATPSGITLSPEGGAHQSVGTPLIGMSQDGLASFEPAFVDELAAVMAWAFEYIQRQDKGEGEKTWLRDETGGSVYLRLSTRKLEQPQRPVDPSFAEQVVQGGYWLRPPGPGCEVVIAYQGAVAPEAIQAAGLIAEDRRDVGVLAITSADRLSAGWHAVQRARHRGDRSARSYVEELLEPLPRHAGIVSVLDGHPSTLSWLGAVYGHRQQPLGVEHFGQSGEIGDLYRHHGIDTRAIVNAAQASLASRPVRYAAS